MSEKENRWELRRRLFHAGDKEEVRAILGLETTEEEIDRVWWEIEAHRPAAGLEDVDDDELEAVSGGADRDWETEGCSASVEYGSKCWSDDYCSLLSVTYDNYDPCPKGGRHDWKLLYTVTNLIGIKKCDKYECQKCEKLRNDYEYE